MLHVWSQLTDMFNNIKKDALISVSFLIVFISTVWPWHNISFPFHFPLQTLITAL